ncbi:unnamed protein product [Sphagnum troendelagicum]|uniref:Uncharacterized protein n=1 Tax=Sphagnum troendelagicum TaxID=128251 RepID=A0ABP0TKL5_9BRYO
MMQSLLKLPPFPPVFVACSSSSLLFSPPSLSRINMSSAVNSLSHSFPTTAAAAALSSGKSFVCRAQEQEDKELLVKPSESNGEIAAEANAVLEGWRKVGLYLFGFGFVLGPPLDTIHSRVELQIYDMGALDIAGLHTDIWVFPMLGVFYSVVGLLQLVLDNWLAPKQQKLTASLDRVGLSFLSLAVLLEVSAELYKAGVPYNVEAYILFALAELNWWLFDNTWWGFALASVVGVGCPLAEVPITKFFGLWHYPNGNFELFGESTVTWVLACYFFYTPFISNLARWLRSVVAKEGSKSIKQ